ncbi:MAG: hypothetical protein ACJ71N_11750 [Terriglobales bacterium]|jgi:hypothetical protein
MLTMLVALLLATVSASAQDASEAHIGLPVDWSNRHVTHTSAPNTADFEQEARHEPRALYNWIFRQRSRQAAAQVKTFRSAPKTRSRVDWNFTLGAGKVAPNMSPAKYSFNISSNPDCTNDFVTFGLDVAGSGTQPNLVGLKNLYSEPGGTGFCAGTGPSVRFAYNVTTVAGGRVLTSPALSFDGTKIAFIESAASSAVFHVLKIGTTGSNGAFTILTNTYTAVQPDNLGIINNATMSSLTYSATASNTRSSLWIDYANDIAYFGDDAGLLYKTTCVFFCGASSPALATGWPITVSAATTLAPPVLDSTNNKIFVGSSDGKLYMVPLASCPGVGCAAAIKNLVVGAGGASGGVIDAVLLDGTFGTVVAVSGKDASNNGHMTQASNALTSLAVLSFGSASFDLLAPSFDDAYYGNNIGNAAVVGTLDACATNGGSGQAAFYVFSFTKAAGNLSVANPPVVNTAASSQSKNNIPGNPGIGCSPYTELLNGTDRVFFSQSSVPAGKCGSGSPAGGCLFSYSIAGGPSPLGSTPELSGTSAIVVDNVANTTSFPQASSIYFGNQATSAGCATGTGVTAVNGFCAIKLTQANLN